MATQLTLPGVSLDSDLPALRDAWALVPGARKADFEAKLEVDGIRRCLVRIAEAQIKRQQKCRHR